MALLLFLLLLLLFSFFVIVVRLFLGIGLPMTMIQSATATNDRMQMFCATLRWSPQHSFLVYLHLFLFLQRFGSSLFPLLRFTDPVLQAGADMSTLSMTAPWLLISLTAAGFLPATCLLLLFLCCFFSSFSCWRVSALVSNNCLLAC